MAEKDERPHPVLKAFERCGLSYEKLVDEDMRLYKEMLTKRFEAVQRGEADRSQLINLLPHGDPSRVVSWRGEIGVPDPAPNARTRTGLDEVE